VIGSKGSNILPSSGMLAGVSSTTIMVGLVLLIIILYFALRG
jgi:hypothetical protein